MNRFTRIVSEDFQDSVKTWNNKPGFDRSVSTKRREIIGEVSTKNDVYGFLNYGTKKNYPIVAKRARFLRFQSGYRAKTAQGRIAARSGGPFGGTQFRKRVIHPGIKARKFDEQIKKLREKTFENIMLSALEDAILED